MKNTIKMFGIAAMVAIIGFSMVRCDTGTSAGTGTTGGGSEPTSVTYTSKDEAGNTYNLTIQATQEGKAATYTPKGGDNYVLTVNPLNMESSGTIDIDANDNTKFTLKPSSGGSNITVTIVNSGMTSITAEVNGSTTTVTLTPTEWSNVTSLSQVNGSWKAPSTNTVSAQGMTVVQSFSNYIITFNATAKTMSVSGSVTNTFSGGNINESWSSIKTDLQNGFASQPGVKLSFNDTAHSYTMTCTNFSQTITDAQLASLGMQINQNRTKLKFETAGIEVIYTKQ